LNHRGPPLKHSYRQITLLILDLNIFILLIRQKFESLLFAQLWSVLGEGKAENVYQAVLPKKLQRFPQTVD